MQFSSVVTVINTESYRDLPRAAEIYQGLHTHWVQCEH